MTIHSKVAKTAIRAAALADADAIARVHVDTWRTTYDGIVPADFLAQLSYEKRKNQWRDILQRATPREHLLVAVDPSDRVIGFTSGGANRDTAYPFDGELFALYLLKDYQGHGIGRRLFQATYDQLVADGFSGMILWVLDENRTSHFYRHMGGERCGEKTETIGGKPLKEIAYGWSIR